MGRPAVTPRALARLEGNLRRHLAAGWVRAVFAVPAGSPEAPPERVMHGPGSKDSQAETSSLDALVEAAKAAASEGLVKHTYVVDARATMRVDARHGGVKWRHLDEALVAKMTGGKQRHLRPDESADLLRAIGIMNADGTISAKNAKKYKQIDHMVDLARPLVDWIVGRRAVTAEEPLRIVDLACGNSYLTFVMAQALRLRQVPARIHGVDVREDVIERSVERAALLGFDELTFARATIAQAQDNIEGMVGGPIDIVLSLHGCDVASDEALALAIAHEVPGLMVAPCCQVQLAHQLQASDRTRLGAIGEHGLFLRDYAAVLTDALRTEILGAQGYKVDVLEFVSHVHTAKNVLLRARRTERASSHRLNEVAERCHRLGVWPALFDQVPPTGVAPTSDGPHPSARKP